MPRASIILVNYNGRELLPACLKSLENQSYRDFEVLIVDNCSTDGSLSEIHNIMKENQIAARIRVIPLDTNSGFSGGNLAGLKQSSGEFIGLLNNDAEADVGWLEELVKAMDSHPGVGICASKMLVYGTNVIDSAGIMYSTSLKGFNRGEGEERQMQCQQDYVFGACGGAVLYRRTMIDHVGFLDPDFFLIHEDVDVSFRAQLGGWKVLYVPSAVVHHKVRSTIRRNSDIAVFYTLRNAEFVKIKNVPVLLFLKYLPQFAVGLITEFFYFALRHKRFRLYLRAKLEVLRMLPTMWGKRRAIMRDKRVSNQYLSDAFSPVLKKDFLKTKLRKLFFD